VGWLPGSKRRLSGPCGRCGGYEFHLIHQYPPRVNGWHPYQPPQTTVVHVLGFDVATLRTSYPPTTATSTASSCAGALPQVPVVRTVLGTPPRKMPVVRGVRLIRWDRPVGPSQNANPR
jgi:hypothetical protein